MKKTPDPLEFRDKLPIPASGAPATARMAIDLTFAGAEPINLKIRWTTCTRDPVTPGVPSSEVESGVLPAFNDQYYATFRMTAPPYLTTVTISWLSCENGRLKQHKQRLGLTYEGPKPWRLLTDGKPRDVP